MTDEKRIKELEEENYILKQINKPTKEIIDDIHDLLEVDKEYPNRLYLQSLTRKELLKLKYAIQKLKEKINFGFTLSEEK
jgi:hypothetical protein